MKHYIKDITDDTIQEPHNTNLNQFYLFLGRPGSGKTTNMINLIVNKDSPFYRKFDEIFVFTPSSGTIQNNPLADLEDDHIFTEVDEENLIELMDMIKNNRRRNLIIMDDVLAGLMNRKTSFMKTLGKLVFNRRHLAGKKGSVQIFMTAQAYTGIPAPIRKQITHLYAFGSITRKEIETVYRDIINLTKKQFEELMNKATSRHDYILIDVDNRKYYLNDEKIEL